MTLVITKVVTPRNETAHRPAMPVEAAPTLRACQAYCDVESLDASTIRAVNKLLEQHPQAIIVSDDYLRHCDSAVARAFMDLVHNRKDPQPYITVNDWPPQAHKMGLVSDNHFSTLCRRLWR